MGTCPLLNRGCVADCCEWWDANSRKCAVLLIAETLHSLSNDYEK